MKKLKKVLIVEDDTAFLEALSGELKGQDILVLTASDGQSGLETALKEHPDLIWLDIMLPVMDGIAMLKKLREDEWGKTVPVVLLTQVDYPNKIAEALENGVFKYFVKADHSVPDIIKETEKYFDELN